jgi:hypothetical protein
MSFHHFPSNLKEKLTGGLLCHFLKLQGSKLNFSPFFFSSSRTWIFFLT